MGKIKWANESDTESIKALWLQAFPPDEPFFTREYRPERALIYTEKEQVVSMLHMLPRVIILPECRLRTGYIMGVATHTEYRRKGFAGELLRAAIQFLEEQGYDCAMLLPASEALAAYYSRFGLTVRGKKYTGLGGIPEGRPAVFADIPFLSALYDGAFPNRAERTVFEWETILMEYSVVIADGEYAVWDERGVLERIPVPPDAVACPKAACLKLFCNRELTESPYINLLFT